MSIVVIEDELLERATPAQRSLYVRYLIRKALETDDWRLWLRALFPTHVTAPWAAHHEQYWDWLWAIGPEKPRPFVGVWPRGGAKSTSAELGAVLLGGRQRRNYGLYICSTQAQADDHVGTIATLLESPRVADALPDLASRAVGKYGSSKGWRRNRLRTASGFTIDALGLDVAARGAKLDEQRPDFMVFDDLDDTDDGLAETERKERAITRKLLPAGAPNLAVLAIQNLVHGNGIFARLAGVAEEPAEYLADREVSGPIVAVEGLVIEEKEGRHRIIAGAPTWAGQDLEVCEAQITEFGPASFRIEAQHEVDLFIGGMWADIDFDAMRCTLEEVPALVQVEVWVDPAVTDRDKSDSMGIQADGISENSTIYRLRSWERRSSPLEALKKAIVWAYELGAIRVGVETDQGGDTWQSVYREALAAVLETHEQWKDQPAPFFDERKAGAGYGSKVHRASQMHTDYERPGRFKHVIGTHDILERALKRFPLVKPYDLVDSAFWAWNALREHGQGKTVGAQKINETRLPAVPRSNGTPLMTGRRW